MMLDSFRYKGVSVETASKLGAMSAMDVMGLVGTDGRRAL